MEILFLRRDKIIKKILLVIFYFAFIFFKKTTMSNVFSKTCIGCSIMVEFPREWLVVLFFAQPRGKNYLIN